MAKRLKSLMYFVRREQVPCRVFTNGYRASFLRLSRQERGQVWLHRFWPGLPVLPWPRKQGLNQMPALTYLPLACQTDIPHLFAATVERDETYLGRQWKNKRHHLKAGATKPGRGTSQRPVFGILCPGRKVWAQVVPDVEAKTLFPWICRRLEIGSSVCSDPGTGDTGIAAKG